LEKKTGVDSTELECLILTQIFFPSLAIPTDDEDEEEEEEEEEEE
jgi:hypothetical protein